jgi:hypothetical protein
MSIEKMAKLVEGLETLTIKEKIEWEETEKEYMFQTSFSDFTIRLSKEYDNEVEESFYCLALVNSKGREIESITGWMLKAVLDKSESRLSNLYNRARSMALGIEKFLDNVLTELDKKGDNPS